MYLSELRALAQWCKFGDTLDDMLRDHLVCGVNKETIQRRLLGESELTLKKALEIVQGLEAAARNVREIRTQLDVSRQKKSMKLADGEARVVLGVARTATEPHNVCSAWPSVIIVAKWATSKVFEAFEVSKKLLLSPRYISTLNRRSYCLVMPQHTALGLYSPTRQRMDQRSRLGLHREH